jgi:membrane protein DedA with SNARE-associated domain
MLESLTELASSSPWTYAVVFAVAALDAVLPVVPSETILVAAAALAARGKLELPAVVALAAAGALLGDNVAYWLGRRLGPRVRERLTGAAARRRLAWAHDQLARRGASVILVARFVPGGRTAATLTAGMVGLPWRRFLVYDLAAAALWASYGGAIGFFGGSALEDWQGLALALGIAFVLALAVEQVRRLVRRVRTADAADAGR